MNAIERWGANVGRAGNSVVARRAYRVMVTEGELAGVVADVRRARDAVVAPRRIVAAGVFDVAVVYGAGVAVIARDWRVRTKTQDARVRGAGIRVIAFGARHADIETQIAPGHCIAESKCIARHRAVEADNNGAAAV